MILQSLAINLGNMGGAYLKLGNSEKARDFFIQSLTLVKAKILLGYMAPNSVTWQFISQNKEIFRKL